VLEALILLVSVRRSLFSSEADRKRFLAHIVRGIIDIMREQAGFADSACFHNFARLLSQVKKSYQLSDLMATEGYAEWVDLTAAFTVTLCQQPIFAANSLHYILSLWSTLVSSVPYMIAEHNSKAPAPGTPAGRAPDPGFDAHIPKVRAAAVHARDPVVEEGMGGRVGMLSHHATTLHRRSPPRTCKAVWTH